MSSPRPPIARFCADLSAAIRHLASYYAAILNESTHKRQRTSVGSSSRGTGERITVTLVTDDADNKRKAIAGGIAALSVREFVETQATEVSSILMDLLAAVGTGPEKRRGAALYPEVCLASLGPSIVADRDPPSQYLVPSILQAGIKAGKLLQGHFNPNQYNYKEVRSDVSPHSTISDPKLVPQATVSCHGRDKPILIVGLEGMNRSVAGDVVVVEVLPESEWQGAADDVVDSDGAYTLISLLLYP